MNIINKIRLFFAVKSKIEEVRKMKAGWKTTEFWLTIFTNAGSLIGTYGGFIPEPWGLIVGAIVTAGYQISRGLAKKG